MAVAWELVRCSAPAPGVAWMVGYRSQGQPECVHRGLPSTYLTWVVALDAPVRAAWSEPDLVRTRGLEVLVAGLQDRPAYVVQPRRQEGIQLSVDPLAARAVLGVPAGELAGVVEEGLDVLGGDAARLQETVAGRDDWASRFEVVREFVVGRRELAAGAGQARPEVVAAWRQITRTRGAVTVPELAAHTQLSARQLREQFRRELGVGVKTACRLARFEAVRRTLAARVHDRAPLALADLAARLGYADQSHLVREFRQLAGTSPTRWAEEERRNIQAGGHLGA